MSSDTRREEPKRAQERTFTCEAASRRPPVVDPLAIVRAAAAGCRGTAVSLVLRQRLPPRSDPNSVSAWREAGASSPSCPRNRTLAPASRGRRCSCSVVQSSAITARADYGFSVRLKTAGSAASRWAPLAGARGSPPRRVRFPSPASRGPRDARPRIAGRSKEVGLPLRNQPEGSPVLARAYNRAGFGHNLGRGVWGRRRREATPDEMRLPPDPWVAIRYAARELIL